MNAPKIHQRIIGRLMMQIGILYYLEKSIPFEPLPETMIDESQTSPTSALPRVNSSLPMLYVV